MNFVDRLKAFEQKLESEMASFKCPVHLCLGQEEVPNAIHQYAKPDDWVFSTHRSHGHYLAKGGSEEKLLAEIKGLPEGVNEGYAGSQCFSDPNINFHSSAIVGGLVGVAVGTAMALKGSGNIVICCIGDAVAEQGVFWESVSFVGLHRLPVLFLCENNGYSIHVPQNERQPGGVSYKVHGFRIAIKKLNEAFRDARSFGPQFVETFPERTCAHVGVMEDLR